MYSYLLHCIPIWIQLLCQTHQNKNEWRGGCLMRFGLVAGNHRCSHNTTPAWVLYLNHHHKFSMNHTWNQKNFVSVIKINNQLGLKIYLKQEYLTHSWNDILCQNVKNWVESIVQLTVEYSRYNLFHFDIVEDIQVM